MNQLLSLSLLVLVLSGCSEVPGAAVDTSTATATPTATPSATSSSGTVTMSISNTPVIGSVGETFSITVTAYDGNGSVDTSSFDSLTVTSTDGTATLPSPTLSSGTATFTVTPNTSGSQTFTVTNASHTSISANTGSITVLPSGDYSGVIQMGQTAGDLGNLGAFVFSDSSGNLFAVGLTTSNFVSCGGVSANCSGSSQGTYDYFISKYNKAGVWQWTKQLGETGKTLTVRGGGVDGSGNVYVGGLTNGNLASCGGVSANCSGSLTGVTQDYFISKYSSDGTWLWTKQMGGTGNISTLSISVSSTGDVAVVGTTFSNLVSCGGVTASCSGASQGTSDLFVSKYNTSGVWQWTKELGETAKTTSGNSVSIDSSGNVDVLGQSTGDMTTCSGVSASCTGSSTSGGDYFVTQYNSAGDWQWTKQLGEATKTNYAYQLATDGTGNVYVSGYTNANLVSCAGVSASCSGSSQGTTDYFISKYSNLGVWAWTQQLGETAKSAYGSGIASDSSGNIYVSGYTTGNLVSCGGVSASCSGSAQGTFDSYISKYNTSGTWKWTKQIGETAKSTLGAGKGGISTASGYAFMSGYTTGDLTTCGGISASCTGSSAGGQDFFIVKFAR